MQAQLLHTTQTRWPQRFKALAFHVMLTSLVLGSGCAGCDDNQVAKPPPAPQIDMAPDMEELSQVTRIEFGEESAMIEVGETYTLTYTLYDQNDDVIEEERAVIWGTTSQSVATVVGGVITGNSIGVATISASVGGVSADFTIDVQRKGIAEIQIEPMDTTVKVKGTTQMRAKTFARDGQELLDRDVIWSQDDSSIATINQNGLVTGIAAGQTTVSATAEGVSSNATITVTERDVASLRILPTSLSLRVNESENLTAIALDEDGIELEGKQVTWASEDEDIATIDEAGTLSGLSVGQVKISASLGDVSAELLVSVTPEAIDQIVVTPDAAEMVVGDTQTFRAAAVGTSGAVLDGRTLTWSSSNNDVLTVTPLGLVSAVGSGTAQVSARSEGVFGTATILVLNPIDRVEITPIATELLVNESIILDATTFAVDGTEVLREVTWSSNDDTIASVDDNGRVTGHMPGTANITAESEGKSATAVVIVKPQPVDSVTLTPSVEVVGVGDTLQLVAKAFAADGSELMGRAVSFSSDDMSVATVDANGVVSGLTNGDATITATIGMVSATAVIVVPVGFKYVTAGGNHTCAVDENDTLLCWGRDINSVLGTGGTGDSLLPVEALGMDVFKQLSALTLHNCGVDATDKIYCWGANFSGQIGRGDTTGSASSPTPIAASQSFNQISAGGSHTCAISTTNKLRCWGGNFNGQLGILNGFSDELTPEIVDDTMSFSQLASGGSHTCAISTPDNTLYCWGRNNNGQLGISNGFSNISTPTAVDGTRKYTWVAAGPDHTCAIAENGLTYCWGANDDDQLGVNTMGNSTAMAQVVSGGKLFTRVWVGSLHSCGMEADGDLFCWGANNNGQLGDGTNTQSTSPVQVGAGALKFTEFDAGSEHNCGISTDSVLYCWGSNSFGRLGNGTNIGSNVPYPVVVE